MMLANFTDPIRPVGIEALGASLFHDDYRDRLFMVLTAYFDESGTHGRESSAMNIAGFIATASQWGAYERGLADLNARFAVSVFHAKDLRQTKGPFKGWDTETKGTYTYEFLRLADDNLTCGLSVILRSELYQSVYRARPFPRTARPDTQYGICVRGAILRAIKRIEDKPEEWPLNIVLECGHRNAADAMRVFSDVKRSLPETYRKALRSISFDTKQDSLALAAADALAYAIFRMTTGLSKHPSNPNAAVVGHSIPPYYVSKIPLSRMELDAELLTIFRDKLFGPQENVVPIASQL